MQTDAYWSQVIPWGKQSSVLYPSESRMNYSDIPSTIVLSYAQRCVMCLLCGNKWGYMRGDWQQSLIHSRFLDVVKDGIPDDDMARCIGIHKATYFDILTSHILNTILGKAIIIKINERYLTQQNQQAYNLQEDRFFLPTVER